MTQRSSIWVRRIVSTTILIAVVCGLGYGAYKAVNWVWSQFTDTHEANRSAGAPRPVEIAPCSPSDLELTLQPSATHLYVSEELQATLGIKGTNATGCELEPGQLEVALTTGPTTVWTPLACAGNPEVLLVTADTEVKRELQWDARVYDQCELVDDLFAEPGTYRLKTSVGGQAVGEPVVITIE